MLHITSFILALTCSHLANLRSPHAASAPRVTRYFCHTPGRVGALFICCIHELPQQAPRSKGRDWRLAMFWSNFDDTPRMINR